MLHPSQLSFSVPKTEIVEINKQYKEFQNIVILLMKQMEQTCADKSISDLFFKLTHLHTHHFIQEQITLSKYKFEDLHSIKTLHSAFLDKLISLKEDIDLDHKVLCKGLIEFLEIWSEEYFVKNQIAVAFLKYKGVV